MYTRGATGTALLRVEKGVQKKERKVVVHRGIGGKTKYNET